MICGDLFFEGDDSVDDFENWNAGG
jgi:hypothetical protein